MVPGEEAKRWGVAQLLLHFGWTWVGLIASDTEDGEEFRRSLSAVLARSGVCVAFAEMIPALMLHKGFSRLAAFLRGSQANVLVYSGDSQTLFGLARVVKQVWRSRPAAVGKVWVATALQDANISLFYNIFDPRHSHAFFSFWVRNPQRQTDARFPPFSSAVRQSGEEAFDCTDLKPARSVKSRTRCTEKAEPPPREVLQKSLSLDSCIVYHAVQALARVLHTALSARPRRKAHHGTDPPRLQPWQVLPPAAAAPLGHGKGKPLEFGAPAEKSSGVGMMWNLREGEGQLGRGAPGQVLPTPLLPWAWPGRGLCSRAAIPAQGTKGGGFRGGNTENGAWLPAWPFNICQDSTYARIQHMIGFIPAMQA